MRLIEPRSKSHKLPFHLLVGAYDGLQQKHSPRSCGGLSAAGDSSARSFLTPESGRHKGSRGLARAPERVLQHVIAGDSCAAGSSGADLTHPPRRLFPRKSLGEKSLRCPEQGKTELQTARVSGAGT